VRGFPRWISLDRADYALPELVGGSATLRVKAPRLEGSDLSSIASLTKGFALAVNSRSMGLATLPLQTCSARPATVSISRGFRK
jgi:hypothetical protein